MKKILLLFIFSPLSILFAQKNIRPIKIDVNSYRSQLLRSPHESIIGIGKLQQSTNVISLPYQDTTLKQFRVVEYSILPKGANTEFKTYYGQKIDEPSVSCRISMANDKMYVAIFNESEIIAIEPRKNAQKPDEYETFVQEATSFECNAEHNLLQNGRIRDIEAISNYSNGAVLRTYSFAIMVTNEFYSSRGGTNTSVNTDVIATINTLNGIFERDLAVRFVLVSPINPSSSNFFYRNTNPTNSYNQNITSVHSLLNTVFGSANYDLGHCLHNSGGGVAYLSATCNNSVKGGAWSGIGSPTDMFVFAHEVGHQFNANHTFSGNGGGCTAGNLSSSDAYEPGSGNTMMSYSGICSNNLNITGGKVNYFHTNSLQSMINYINTGSGSTCATTSNTGNNVPVAVAGTYGIIPKNTPFVLSGSAIDANNDELSYTWEQYDLAASGDIGALGNSTVGSGGYTSNNSITGPLFRTTQSSSPVRIFPSLTFILNSANNPDDKEGEDLPSVSRTMNFRLTVRDNRNGGGGVHMSSTAIVVDGNSGPFLITSQNKNTYWVQGSAKTITWSVNNTNNAPINCTNVDILFSSDNGTTFSTVLIANTPNDGSQIITVPNISTTLGRIKVVPSNPNLVFFDINNVPINVVNSLPTCAAETSNLSSGTAVSGVVGDASLNLNLYNFVPVSNISRTITNADPIMPLIGYSSSGCVIPYSNITYYEPFTFRVSATGSYTFTITPGYFGGNNISVFLGSYQSGCTNWVGSSLNMNSGVAPSNTLTLNLSANTTYMLTVSYQWDRNSTGTVGVSFSGAGIVQQLIPVENSFYSYQYVIVNTQSNVVRSIQNDTDLSNASLFAAGNYVVYGMSYLTDNVDLGTYVNQNISMLQSAISSGTICAKLSSNSKAVLITPNCSNGLTLSGQASTGVQQANQTITSSQVINSGQSVTYRAGNSITLTAGGFTAANGSVFKAEIGGCN
ncbi:MAG: reprolysin-like metallopeptidase [Emticicia sp.]|uniref:reprolysin-like metallopeptidase n=1 Tax=Emticicia sp. TaxID=1930953 RepID=UPI003BA807BB